MDFINMPFYINFKNSYELKMTEVTGILTSWCSSTGSLYKTFNERFDTCTQSNNDGRAPITRIQSDFALLRTQFTEKNKMTIKP